MRTYLNSLCRCVFIWLFILSGNHTIEAQYIRLISCEGDVRTIPTKTKQVDAKKGEFIPLNGYEQVIVGSGLAIIQYDHVLQPPDCPYRVGDLGIIILGPHSTHTVMPGFTIQCHTSLSQQQMAQAISRARQGQEQRITIFSSKGKAEGFENESSFTQALIQHGMRIGVIPMTFNGYGTFQLKPADRLLVGCWEFKLKPVPSSTDSILYWLYFTCNAKSMGSVVEAKYPETTYIKDLNALINVSLVNPQIPLVNVNVVPYNARNNAATSFLRPGDSFYFQNRQFFVNSIRFENQGPTVYISSYPLVDGFTVGQTKMLGQYRIRVNSIFEDYLSKVANIQISF